MPVESIEIKNKRNVAAENLVQRLEQVLRGDVSRLRGHQVASLKKLVAALKNGTYHGLFRHPTGSGKTVLFGEILLASAAPSLVLVPRRTLIEDTADELVESVGHARENMKMVDVEEGGNASGILEGILSEPGFSGSKNVIIMTYQSFVSIKDKKPELFDRLFADIKMLICDEAHRSLGEKTKEAILLGHEMSSTRTRVTSALSSAPARSDIPEDPYIEGDTREAAIENEAGKIIEENASDLINLMFTATPILGKKDVASEYGVPEIHRVTYGELIENGTLVMPREVDLGRAVCRTRFDHKDGVPLTDDDLDQITEGFVMEGTGKSVYEASIDAYIDERAKAGGYLPGVAFCRNIEEADRFHKLIDARNAKGGPQVRAIRCTSSNDSYDEGTPSDEARSQLENNHADIIITVSKVSEGWNVPTLRCALVLTPMKSPARIIQGIGRIMRSIPADSEFPPKSEENTCIIQPKWVIKPERRFEDRPAVEGAADEEAEERSPSGSNTSDDSIFESKSFTQTLYDSDELKLEALGKRTPEVEFNPYNSAMLRALFESPLKLIQNGRWIDISREQFSHEAPGVRWNIKGSDLVEKIEPIKRKGQNPGNLAESLARTLWPEEFEEVNDRIFNPNSDDHLRLLIGGPEYLIYKGKGLGDWGDKLFINAERGWSRLGKNIPIEGSEVKDRGPSEAEELARRLWPEASKELLKGTKKFAAVEKLQVSEESINKVKKAFGTLNGGVGMLNSVETFREHISDQPTVFARHLFAKNSRYQLTGMEILRLLGILEPGDNIPPDFIKRIYKIVWPKGFDE